MPPEALLRPLAVDIAQFLVPIVVGIAAFLLGRCFSRWSLAVRACLVGLTVGAIFVVLAILFHAIPRPIELAFSRVGGVVVVLCWMILGVIGFSWASQRPQSDFFARFFMALMPLVLIGVESGGSLWFRFGNTEPWHNRPTAAAAFNRMVQTTKMTCLPVSAAMLMSQYELVDVNKDDCDFSEGELAYLANTSFFGTDGHVMARVITQKIDRSGVSAEMIRATYDDMVERGAPFIAEVKFENVGKHAVLVDRINKHSLRWIDPLNAIPQELQRELFENLWTGSVIVIDGLPRPAPKDN